MFNVDSLHPDDGTDEEDIVHDLEINPEDDHEVIIWFGLGIRNLVWAVCASDEEHGYFGSIPALPVTETRNKFIPDLLQRVFDPWTSDKKEQLSSVRNWFECDVRGAGCDFTTFSYYAMQSLYEGKHSPVCPISQLPPDEVQSIPESSINRGINVGVAIIVESSDSHILMTQRSEHMRTFPRAWVPPGGHLECDESLLQCGFREVQEETGLVFTDDNSETSVLCLWESVYPVILGLGVPTSHHIVIYLHTRVEQTWQQLQTQVQLDPAEVQACAWLSTDMVEELCTGRSDGTSHHIKFISDSSGNGTSPAKLDISKMFTSLLWKCGYIYSGSQLALTRWLDLHKKLDSKLSSKI
uniref:m7GpppN-mRNA hydrolase NUDT17 n=1 Tax=Timema poppense TaxID=170557 RepID=A0A7R9GYT2_TIMPO|nr:unnamed protein product [Timema poppensis]